MKMKMTNKKIRLWCWWCLWWRWWHWWRWRWWWWWTCWWNQSFVFSPLPVFNSAITSNSMFASLSETRHHVFPPHFSWLNWFVCCFLAKHSVQYLATCPRSPERIVLRLQLLLATSLKMLFPNFEKTKLSPGQTCVCAKLHGSISSKLSRKMPRFPRSSLAQWPHVAPRPSCWRVGIAKMWQFLLGNHGPTIR